MGTSHNLPGLGSPISKIDQSFCGRIIFHSQGCASALRGLPRVIVDSGFFIQNAYGSFCEIFIDYRYFISKILYQPLFVSLCRYHGEIDRNLEWIRLDLVVSELQQLTLFGCPDLQVVRSCLKHYFKNTLRGYLNVYNVNLPFEPNHSGILMLQNHFTQNITKFFYFDLHTQCSIQPFISTNDPPHLTLCSRESDHRSFNKTRTHEANNL